MLVAPRSTAHLRDLVALTEPGPGPPVAWDRELILETFLEEYGHEYGYGLQESAWEDLRAREWPSLRDTVYLDFSASPPVASAVLAALPALAQTLYSNPHSRSPSSVATSLAVDAVRVRVMRELFGLSVKQCKDWDVVWTANTTAALKLVAESFDWTAGGLDYARRAHTSLVGMRGPALAAGAQACAIELDEELSTNAALFAYPAACNATGDRVGLEPCKRAKQARRGIKVLVDAAAWLPTGQLCLENVPDHEAPDFVAGSFYKIFGYPTSLGFLLVRRSSASLLLPTPFFGGGTPAYYTAHTPFTDSRFSSSSSQDPPHRRLENGTIPFLEILALNQVMDAHASLFRSIEAGGAHAMALANLARQQMKALRHPNGQPVVQIHRAFTVAQEGSAIGFTLLNTAGAQVGHVEVERLASLNGFSLRTGGLCNVGVVAGVMGLSDEDLCKRWKAGGRCGDDEEFWEGKPTGIARISFGAASTARDVLNWVAFLRRFWVAPEVAPEGLSAAFAARGSVATLTLYPIKSAGGQVLPTGTRWPVTPLGLKHDREWMLVDAISHRALSQKRLPRMVLVRPTVDLEQNVMRVTAPSMPELLLPLTRYDGLSSGEVGLCGSVLSTTDGYAEDVNEWFSRFLGVACYLARHAEEGSAGSPSQSRHGHFPGTSAGTVVPILLSNESPFLLIGEASVARVNDLVSADSHAAITSSIVDASCFRANIVLSSSTFGPFAEDAVDLIAVGPSCVFQVLARCRRCLMVCVDQQTGKKGKEPFNCLARHRKNSRGRIEFGVHLMLRRDLSAKDTAAVDVAAGDEVRVLKWRE